MFQDFLLLLQQCFQAGPPCGSDSDSLSLTDLLSLPVKLFLFLFPAPPYQSDSKLLLLLPGHRGALRCAGLICLLELPAVQEAGQGRPGGSPAAPFPPPPAPHSIFICCSQPERRHNMEHKLILCQERAINPACARWLHIPGIPTYKRCFNFNGAVPSDESSFTHTHTHVKYLKSETFFFIPFSSRNKFQSLLPRQQKT